MNSRQVSFALIFTCMLKAALAAEADPVAERIKRVEAGLRPAVVVADDPPPNMVLGERMRFYKVPGISIAVVNGGRIEWTRSYGVRDATTNAPVDADTLFQAGSISKSVTAFATMRLVQAGTLSLDRSLNDQLKSWKIPDNEFTAAKQPTLRQLLSHTAGFTVHGYRGYATDQPLPAFKQVLDGIYPANSLAVRVDIEPGTTWRYSGGGYEVLQQLLMDVEHEPFPVLMDRLALKPLGMAHSTFEQPLPEALAANAASGHENGRPIAGRWHAYPEMAAAGLWTTPGDLARLVIELQRAASGNSTLLERKTADQMLTRELRAWGLGVGLDGEGDSLWFSHGGVNEGFEALMVGYASQGSGAVVMTNGMRGQALALEIMRAIAKEYGWKAFLRPEKHIVKVDTSIYDGYVGEYEINRHGSVVVRREGEKLFGKPTGQPELELLPESPTRFFIRQAPVEMEFETDATGKANALILHQRGSQRAVRVR